MKKSEIAVIALGVVIMAITAAVQFRNMERANADGLIPAIECSTSLNNCPKATPSAEDNQIIVLPQTPPTTGQDYVIVPAVPNVITDVQKKAFLTQEKKVITRNTTKTKKSTGLLPPFTKESLAKKVGSTQHFGILSPFKPVMAIDTQLGAVPVPGYYVNVGKIRAMFIRSYVYKQIASQ